MITDGPRRRGRGYAEDEPSGTSRADLVKADDRDREEYGVRDQHVAQACDAYDIARPRAGHWQRVEHGKAVEAVPLSTATYPAEEIVIIDPATGKPSVAGTDKDAAGRHAA